MVLKRFSFIAALVAFLTIVITHSVSAAIPKYNYLTENVDRNSGPGRIDYAPFNGNFGLWALGRNAPMKWWSEPALRDRVIVALAMWTNGVQYRIPGLNFVEVLDPEEANVGFENDPEITTLYNVVAVAFEPDYTTFQYDSVTAAWYWTNTRVAINLQFERGWTSDIEISGILAHEIGHLLGLDEGYVLDESGTFTGCNPDVLSIMDGTQSPSIEDTIQTCDGPQIQMRDRDLVRDLWGLNPKKTTAPIMLSNLVLRKASGDLNLSWQDNSYAESAHRLFIQKQVGLLWQDVASIYWPDGVGTHSNMISGTVYLHSTVVSAGSISSYGVIRGERIRLCGAAEFNLKSTLGKRRCGASIRW